MLSAYRIADDLRVRPRPDQLLLFISHRSITASRRFLCPYHRAPSNNDIPLPALESGPTS